MASARTYRSKVEVLRDFLRAAEQPAPKTRIIGAANLNPASFQRYLRLCTERDLIVSVSGGYVATPQATPLLEAIDRLMLKASELEAAIHVLGRQVPQRVAVGSGGRQLRHLLRGAWNDVLLTPDGRPNGHAPMVRPSGRGAPNGTGGPDPVPSATPPSARRRRRAGSRARGRPRPPSPRRRPPVDR